MFWIPAAQQSISTWPSDGALIYEQDGLESRVFYNRKRAVGAQELSNPCRQVEITLRAGWARTLARGRLREEVRGLWGVVGRGMRGERRGKAYR